MNKNYKLVVSIAVLGGVMVGGYYWYSYSNSGTQDSKQVKVVDGVEIPTSSADIKGTIVSVEGTEVVIERFVSQSASEQLNADLTAEEKEERSLMMQSLSPEEREAMRLERMAEREERLAEGELQTERITVNIPVGTMIVKNSTTANGDLTRASFSELKAGVQISIWLNDDGSVNVVKIKSL